jgi:hypothetical protein
MHSFDGYTESIREEFVDDLETAIDMMELYVDEYVSYDEYEYTIFRSNQKEMGAFRDDYDNDISDGIRIEIFE